MARPTRSAKELAAEVCQLARTDPDAARDWPAGMVFVAGLHGSGDEARAWPIDPVDGKGRPG